MPVTSHSNVIVTATLFQHRFVWRVRAYAACPTQVRIALTISCKTGTRFGIAFASAITTSEEIETCASPHTVLGTEEAVLNAGARFLRTGPVVMTREEEKARI
jgi:hypothetical protein